MVKTWNNTWDNSTTYILSLNNTQGWLESLFNIQNYIKTRNCIEKMVMLLCPSCIKLSVNISGTILKCPDHIHDLMKCQGSGYKMYLVVIQVNVQN